MMALAQQNEVLLQHIQERQTNLEEMSHYLSELESQLALIFAASPDIIVFLDGQARIVKISDAVHSILGYTREDLIGKEVWDYIAREDEREHLKSRFEELQNKKISYPERTIIANTWKAKNGDVVKLLWRFSVCDEREGHTIAIATNLDCVCSCYKNRDEKWDSAVGAKELTPAQ